MSTRGVIARPVGETGFKGCYAHWDNYPSGTGQTLYGLLKEFDSEFLAQALIDNHPGGWSTINEHVGSEGGKLVITADCFCHSRGEGVDPDRLLTEANASGCGCEYAYTLNPDNTLSIWSSFCGPGKFEGNKMVGMFGFGDETATWGKVATLNPRSGADPDWKALDSQARDDGE